MTGKPAWKEFTESVSERLEANYYRAHTSDDFGSTDVLRFIVFHVNPEKTTEFVEFMEKAMASCDCITNWKLKQFKRKWRYALLPAELDDCSDGFYKAHGINIAKQAFIDIAKLKISVEIV